MIQYLIVGVFGLGLSQEAQDEIPRVGKDFLTYLERSYSQIECVEFDFEGTKTAVGQTEPFLALRGSYRWLRNVGEYANYEYRDRMNHPRIEDSSVRGIRTKRYGGGSGVAEVSVARAPRAFQFTEPCLPGRIFTVQVLFGSAPEINESYSLEGEEFVAGHRCAQIAFSATSRRFLFWLDVSRGSQVLRWESHNNNLLVFRVDRIRLASFDDGNGAHVWLPVYGRMQSYLSSGPGADRPVAFSDTPTSVEEFA